MELDGQRIKRIRESMKLTQEQFAHKLGVTTTTVNRWENGKSHIHRVWLKAIEHMQKEGGRP